MILYPAIDLKDGACVRLIQGDMHRSTVFNTDPPDQARQFQTQGFEWLHVVDLNGSFNGFSVNASAVRAILDNVLMPVQLGGGIRNIQGAEYWFESGVARVILGTVAVRHPAFVKELAKEYPGRVAVGIDVREGKVAVQGWADQTEIPAVDLAKSFEDAGVAAIVNTDIGRDGLMGGPNVEGTAELARAVSIPVIASGGVSSVADIEALKAYEADGITGIILGRALYDGRIVPSEALKVAKG